MELDQEERKKREQQPMSFMDTLKSVLWAMLGVQKEKNAERDFTKGKASHFIVIGVLFAVVFVLVLVFIVNLILGKLA